ncbi:hypothetical protein JCM9279_000852, partial [Rhodotorula babjevae]
MSSYALLVLRSSSAPLGAGAGGAAALRPRELLLSPPGPSSYPRADDRLGSSSSRLELRRWRSSSSYPRRDDEPPSAARDER